MGRACRPGSSRALAWLHSVQSSKLSAHICNMPTFLRVDTSSMVLAGLGTSLAGVVRVRVMFVRPAQRHHTVIRARPYCHAYLFVHAHTSRHTGMHTMLSMGLFMVVVCWLPPHARPDDVVHWQPTTASWLNSVGPQHVAALQNPSIGWR